RYAPGMVVLDGAVIKEVGPLVGQPAGEVVDLRGCVLLPGLINTHTHTPMWLYRGLTEDVPQGEWLIGRMLPLERQLGADEFRAGALAGSLELLLNGVTTVADRYGCMETVATAVEASGLRAIVAHSLFDQAAEAGLAT